LARLVIQINSTGVLKGHVDRIQLHGAQNASHWEVNSSGEDGKFPDVWSGYGFEWTA